MRVLRARVFLAGQAVSMLGDGIIAAAAVAGLLGGDPRPVFAGAGALTLVTATLAWLAGLRREYCQL